jgi:hypothetical protein
MTGAVVNSAAQRLAAGASEGGIEAALSIDADEPHTPALAAQMP